MYDEKETTIKNDFSFKYLSLAEGGAWFPMEMVYNSMPYFWSFISIIIIIRLWYDRYSIIQTLNCHLIYTLMR